MNKNILTQSLIVLVVALVAGVGVYLYQNQATLSDRQSLQNQINELKNQLATPSPAASIIPTPTASSSPQPTQSPANSGTSLYQNKKYGFSLSYPKTWKVTKDANSKAGYGVYFNATAPVDGTDAMADLRIEATSYMKPLDIYAYSVETLESHLRNDNENYRNITAITLNGRNGFKADADVNTFGGGVYYFIPQANKSIIMIHDFKGNSDTQSMINSIKFAQ